MMNGAPENQQTPGACGVYFGRRSAQLIVLLAVGAGNSVADDLHCRFRLRQTQALDDRAFDERTGRDRRNYPPDPQVDFTHLKLDLRFDGLLSAAANPRDPDTRSFRGLETLSFRTLAWPIRTLTLDAVDLRILSVTDASGASLEHQYDDRHLTVRFPAELPAGTDATIFIEYECRDPKHGMSFAMPGEAGPGSPLSVATQGESEWNRYWFIAHDYPNDRMTTEMLVTVPDGLVVVSNGRLVERTPAAGGMVRHHWIMEQPHVSYLVSLVIGDLAVVGDRWRQMPVEYYVPPATKDWARPTFGRTPDMIELFSKRLAYDYPYTKYAQVLVQFAFWGGMENTTATTLFDAAVMDDRARLFDDGQDLISHELAHQWFGDLLTCRSWEHLWLNEGFATFMETVWNEQAEGSDEARYQVWRTMRDSAAADSVDAISGIVWPYYAESDDIFGRPVCNPYGKGASVLHMLEKHLGREVFWAGMQEYVRRYAWRQVETDDFRRSLEDVSGRSLMRFFEQWVYRPGSPHVKVQYAWDEQQRQASVTLQQTQKITADRPAFWMDVDVWLVLADGAVEQRIARMDGRSATLTAECASAPVQVCIDPQSAMLAVWDISGIPVVMRLRQAESGPALAARLSAIRSLAHEDREDVRTALRSIVLDESLPGGLRAETAEVLGDMQHDAARDVLLAGLGADALIANHRVRAAAVRAVGRYRSDSVREVLLRLARQDATYEVEAEACRGLPQQEKCDEMIDVLLTCAKKRSHTDMIRAAAIEGLGKLREPRGVELAMEMSRFGQTDRSRPAAIGALGLLGKSGVERERIRNRLVELIYDSQRASAEAAIAALVELDDDEALPALDSFAKGSAEKRLRDRARDAAARIRSAPAADGKVESLEQRVRKLEAAQPKIERRSNGDGGGADESEQDDDDDDDRR
jgi:aminopeptidase N